MNDRLPFLESAVCICDSLFPIKALENSEAVLFMFELSTRDHVFLKTQIRTHINTFIQIYLNFSYRWNESAAPGGNLITLIDESEL